MMEGSGVAARFGAAWAAGVVWACGDFVGSGQRSCTGAVPGGGGNCASAAPGNAARIVAASVVRTLEQLMASPPTGTQPLHQFKTTICILNSAPCGLSVHRANFKDWAWT